MTTRACECCGEDISHRHVRSRYCLRCRNEGQIGRGRILALRKVNTLVRAGKMPRPTLFSCVDCGNQASNWEHRDYAKPLDVEPVCDICNRKRGPALNNFHVAPNDEHKAKA